MTHQNVRALMTTKLQWRSCLTGSASLNASFATERPALHLTWSMLASILARYVFKALLPTGLKRNKILLLLSRGELWHLLAHAIACIGITRWIGASLRQTKRVRSISETNLSIQFTITTSL